MFKCSPLVLQQLFQPAVSADSSTGSRQLRSIGICYPFSCLFDLLFSFTVSALVFAVALAGAVSESLRRLNALIPVEVGSNYPSLLRGSWSGGDRSTALQHSTSGFRRGRGVAACRGLMACCLLWLRVLCCVCEHSRPASALWKQD